MGILESLKSLTIIAFKDKLFVFGMKNAQCTSKWISFKSISMSQMLKGKGYQKRQLMFSLLGLILTGIFQAFGFVMIVQYLLQGYKCKI